MMNKKVIKLPPASGITGKSTNPYKEYKILRKSSADFDKWVRRQYGRQSARCFYCSCDLSKMRINVEHILPMSKGGQTNSKNMVISCAPCNKAKGSNGVKKKRLKKLYKQSKEYSKLNTASISEQEKIAWQLRWIA